MERPPLEEISLGLKDGEGIVDMSIWDHALILLSSGTVVSIYEKGYEPFTLRRVF